MSKTVEGSQIKLNVHIELPGELTMDDVDFTCTFFVTPTRFTRLSKGEMKRLDADNYIAVVDTRLTGPGEIFCDAQVFLPDGRMETERTNTHQQIVYAKR